MKKYVIFIGSVFNMGGGQMYVNNKQRYVRDNGYEAHIFVNRGKNLVITGFIKEQIYKYEFLSILPFIFTRKKRDRLIEKMLKDIRYLPDDEIIIESNTPIMALWAELFAEKCQGKHLAFMIDEQYSIASNYIDYFDFKLKRGELAGNNESTVARIFNGYKEITESNKCKLSPTCNNVVQNVNNPIIDSIEDGIITIGSIGRLDKPYVMDMVREFCVFAEKYTHKQLQYVFIGGATKKIEKNIRAKFKKYNNVTCIITGYIYPIPENLFPKVDVFVGAAGSSRVSWRYGIPTVTLDTNDHMPIGVLGYTAEKALYREKDAEFSISQLLEKILFEQYLEQFEYKALNTAAVEKSVFDTHMEYVKASLSTKEYYSVDAILLSKREKMLRFLLSILPTKLYIMFRNMIRRIKYN